jgi:hypothetical protein
MMNLRWIVFVGVVADPFCELSVLDFAFGDEGGDTLLCCRLGRVPRIGFLTVYDPR